MKTDSESPEGDNGIFHRGIPIGDSAFKGIVTFTNYRFLELCAVFQLYDNLPGTWGLKAVGDRSFNGDWTR